MTTRNEPMDPAPVPTRSSLRGLLGEVLRSDVDLERFCSDRFYEEVYRRFAGGMERDAKVTLLLDHADHASILDNLRLDFSEATRAHEHRLERAPLRAARAAEPGGPVEVRLFNLTAAREWTIAVTPATTLLELIGELQAVLRVEPWSASGAPKPGRGYRFRCYRSETDAEPLSPHTRMTELMTRGPGRALSLNVEWYRAFRGGPAKGMR